jgi:glycosyltransferase involved in cell wall biosynthesis
LSTLSERIAESYQQSGRSVDRQEVQVLTLAALWRQNVPTAREVHFLKIDVEGLEEAVLRGNDWTANRPWVLVVEATLPMSQLESYENWERLLLAANYHFAYADGLNRFYVAEEHLELLPAFKYPPNVFDAFVSHDQARAEARASQAAAKAQEAELRAAEAEFNSWSDQLQVAIYERSLSWRLTRPLRIVKPVERLSRRRRGGQWVQTGTQPGATPSPPLESFRKLFCVTPPEPEPQSDWELSPYIPVLLDGLEIMLDQKSLADPRGIGRVTRELLAQFERAQPVPEIAGCGRTQEERTKIFFYTSIHCCPRLLPPKSVVLIHDVIPLLYPDLFPYHYRDWIAHYKPVAQQADVIVTVSHSSADDIARLLEIPREAIKVIHNGVSRLPIATGGFPDQPQGPYVVFLGAYDVHKNLDVVLRALKHPAISDLKLVLIGHNRGYQRLVQELDLGDRVCFLGKLDDQHAGYVISRAVALVFPSLYEGFGLPPLEAGLLGTPSVCSSRPAMTELLAGAALFADPESPEAWARAIEALHGDAALREGLASRARVRAQDLSWEISGAKFLELFRSLA